jgi:hypothetical protein
VTAVERPAEPPVYSECVIGYREWRLEDWLLAPVAVGPPWRPGINRAVCRQHENGLLRIAAAWGLSFDIGALPQHKAPAADCTCGIYAPARAPAARG